MGLLISIWRAHVAGGLQAQLDQAVQVTEQLEAQIEAAAAGFDLKNLEAEKLHQAALEAKQSEIDTLIRKHDLSTAETRFRAKEAGKREKALWGIDRMLHQQSRVGISPTALAFYISNWSASVSKHMAIRASDQAGLSAMSKQAVQANDMTQGTAVRVLTHCKQRQHEAKRHALLHRWYCNMATDDRETAIKGYKAGKERLFR